MRTGHQDYVEQYFGTMEWDEITNKLEVICRPFSEVQKMEIDKVLTELHNFFISNTTAQ
jgi:hypothetical protein